MNDSVVHLSGVSAKGNPDVDFIQDIDNFHRRFGFTQRSHPAFLNDTQMAMRLNFLLEELMETAESAGFLLMVSSDAEDKPILSFERSDSEQDLVKFFDGLVDLAYVLFGTSWLCNLPFPDGWVRVHQANMKKKRAESAEESARGTTFDVVKPEGWHPPVLDDLV